MDTINTKKYQYMQISIASSEDIKSWGDRVIDGIEISGEVTEPETIHYRTNKPHPNGLFSERIFGPTKDNQCYCGKSKKSSTEGNICPNCHVEITSSKVRRERMGYIHLKSPVVHTWYFKNSPSKIATLLSDEKNNLKPKDIENLIYYASYIVTDIKPGFKEHFEDFKNSPDADNFERDENYEVQKGTILSEQRHAKYSRLFKGLYTAQTGAEAIRTLLNDVNDNLDSIIKELRDSLDPKKRKVSKQTREKIIKRLELCEAFKNSHNNPANMVMDYIPVIPPDLRPMVPLDGGRFASSDLTDLYRNIISRNLELEKEINNEATQIILKNEKRLIQFAVDSLIDFSKSNKRSDKSNTVKSLSDNLRGKQGRFRQNLLGKRVDYSGRSVIVVGPSLKMYQCGIPRQMALILFKPFIINYLRNHQPESENPYGNEFPSSPVEKISLHRANEMIDNGEPEAMDALEHVIVEHPVLLNRAPTLHRLSIQAFEPKLVEGKAICLHPLVTTAFNADFDGDQMPVHVPLSQEAQAEARLLMLASKNILAPKDGKPIVTPSQDMILGNYYLTIERSEPEREGMAFKDMDEAEHAYEEGIIGLHTRFVVPAKSINRDMLNLHNCVNAEYAERKIKNEEFKNRYLITTIGKKFFNNMFPSFIPYVNAPTESNLTYGVDEKFLVPKGTNYKDYIHNLPLESPVKKKYLSTIIQEVFKQSQLAETSNTLDKMKDIGFYYSTRASITISAFDVVDVQGKQEVLDRSDKMVQKYRRQYERGLISDAERSNLVIKQWTLATSEIKGKIQKMMKDNASTNDIFLMADSGARGSDSNFLQLAGMRGLMGKPNGGTMEIPIRSSFNEGLTMSEYFISSHGARKGSTDTALKTAESGYLTRRLVDVSQDVIITCDDCGTDKGVYVNDIYPDRSGVIEYPEEGKNIEPIVPLRDRILGRFAAEDINYRDENGDLVTVVKRNEFINDKVADRIMNYRNTFYKNRFQDFPGVKIRTILTCNAPNLSGGEHGCATPNGVCRKCYGSDLSTNLEVEKGEVVGVIAAQSIGEPGTQLTMRTFHSGGVAGDDITQGLPRIQDLFEAHEPKVKGIIAKIKGKVTAIEHDEKDNRTRIIIESKHKNKSATPETLTYLTDSGKSAVVKVGDTVKAGQQLSEGLVHPKELIKYAPVQDVQAYILKEVEKVYRGQSVNIQDKHVEIIIKQMLQKVLVIDAGGDPTLFEEGKDLPRLLPGTYISKPELYKIIKFNYEHNLPMPAVKPVLLGITRSSLKSDSFLSAASFQETTRVLTEAAIRGKKDPLEGLKENIIIGGLIPAGTGLVDQIEIDESQSYNKYNLNSEKSF